MNKLPGDETLEEWRGTIRRIDFEKERVTSLEAENKTLRETLGWYADPKNWSALGSSNEFDLMIGTSDQEKLREKEFPGRGGDYVCGKRARASLKPLK